MLNIQKFVKKREHISGELDRGFLFYTLELSDGMECSIDKMREVVSEIKRDFPNAKDEQIAIKDFSRFDMLVLYFYSDEIPVDMELEEFRG